MKIVGTVLLCAVMLLGVSLPAAGQGFEVSFGSMNGDEEGWCIVPLSGGGYLIGGSLIEDTGYETDAALIKIDASGTKVWHKRIKTITDYTSADKLKDVIQTADGGFVATGIIQNSMMPSSEDLLIARFNSDGDTLWTKRYDFKGYDEGNCIQECADGNFIIAGGLSTLSSENEFFVMKTDASGDSLWTLRIDGDYDDYAESVVICADGNYVVSGYTQSLGGYTNHLLLAKIDPNGTILWEKYLPGDAGNCVKVTYASKNRFQL